MLYWGTSNSIQIGYVGEICVCGLTFLPLIKSEVKLYCWEISVHPLNGDTISSVAYEQIETICTFLCCIEYYFALARTDVVFPLRNHLVSTSWLFMCSLQHVLHNTGKWIILFFCLKSEINLACFVMGEQSCPLTHH